MLFAKLMQYTVHFSHTFVVISQVLLCIYQLGFELGIDLKYCLRFMKKLKQFIGEIRQLFCHRVHSRGLGIYKNVERLLTTMMNQIKSVTVIGIFWDYREQFI